MERSVLGTVQLDAEHGASNTSFIQPQLEIKPSSPRLPSPVPEDVAEALFEEARERARRRRRRQIAGLVVLLLAVAAVVAIVAASDGGGGSPGGDERPLVVRPEQVLARGPYMGVSCARPNAVACDRIGLAVWTRRPARAVRATIAGRRFMLDDPGWSGPPKRGLRRMFAGFLDHAGLLRREGALAVGVENAHSRWLGDPPVYAQVHLTIRYADGTARATRLRIQLSPGWG